MNKTKTEYPVRNCESCKHCVWRKSHYENVVTNDCKKNDEIAKLSMDEMLYHIQTDTCRFYETGETEYELNTEVFDD